MHIVDRAMSSIEWTSRAIYSIVRGTPRLGASVQAARSGRRRLGDLADVTAIPVAPSSRQVQYWTFSHVEGLRDHTLLAGLPLVYDLTFLSPKPVGWERSKTHGHVHVGSGGGGFAELYEVLEGRAGFLVQDLLPGPTASFAVLIEADAGDSVVIPPLLHHAAVNLGSTMLVLGDMVARSAQDDYGSLKEARGMAHYIATDGGARPNPAYSAVPRLTRLRAAEWSDAPRGPLYMKLLAEPSSFEWLFKTERFPDYFPQLLVRHGNGVP